MPVYLKAQKVAGQLQQAVEAQISKLGKSLSQGAAIIVDGADEAGSRLAADLLYEARILVNAWAKTTVVITSRPIPILVESEEAVKVPLISDQDAYALVERFSGQQITPYVTFKWPQSVHNAIHRPLFAILLGIYLRDRNMMAPNSEGELLSNLVERSLRQARASNPDVEQVLQRLAALSTDRTTGLVSRTEVASTSKLQMLLDSGLVIEDAGNISFPLPILSQWFAAHSLAAGIPDPNDLTNDLERLERWRYPLAIFVGYFDHDTVSKLLVPLAEKHPAFTAEIVNEELARTGWNYTQKISLPLLDECGQRIRTAMQAWVKGSDTLSPVIAPVRKDGTLQPIGIQIQTEEGRLKTAWYRGNETLANIVKLPLSELPSFPNWPQVRQGKPSHKSPWAWQWTLHELVTSLSKLLQNRMLPVTDGTLLREAVWQTALKVTRREIFYQNPIPFNEIEKCISSLPWNIFHSRMNEQMRRHYLNQLTTEVNRLREIGEAELRPPWPGPDCRFKGGWIWESYSQQQILARAKAVYAGAIEGYQQLVSTWFPKFAPHLATAVTLPARLVGVIVLPKPDDELKGILGLEWYFEALPYEQQSYVDFRIGEDGHFMGDSSLHSRLDKRLLSLRPEAARWIRTSIHSAILDVFKPTSATELAYKWLWDDLKRVSWVDGLLGNAPL
ncbi:hypothetical protein H6S82_00135 [Planktothrix sp. FACHB-1355]|uniref:Uncharacterized protein n=1 Tax=Aerosakkonema funiforme FACHB-1375 TaxID=2949571 RepID=A0A926VDH8_9CYAN|nr:MULTISPECIES: hypothetical protein [Oscillatoriales]MBD2181861.1 hypothetical protein [Aerosakkonema funiforme FACHB-1375]MBD3557281.1 hypothetical protein [Planktothrix sp. FACHB-1355]